MSDFYYQNVPSNVIGLAASQCGLPWDDAQDAELTQLASEGLSRKEIALKMGRTPTSIQSRCRVLGVHIRRDVFGGALSIRQYERCGYEKRADQEARDRRFIRALAVAIYNGEHLPRNAS